MLFSGFVFLAQTEKGYEEESVQRVFGPIKKHYTEPGNLNLKATEERQQTCGKLTFPAPVPNLDIEEPMDWTDSSGETRMSTLMSTTKSNA